MSDSSPCPARSELEGLAEGRTGDADSLERLERHLSICETCRDTLESILQASADSGLLRQVADWKPEQEKFQPVFRTVLDTSFRLGRSLDVTKFPFVASVSGQAVSGSIGHLELRELVGTGGMGAVFRAFDPELEREVAVKALRPELAGREDVAHLFLDEARAAAALHHENVLPIYHVARDEGEVCSFAMPVIEGGSLAELLEAKGDGLPFERVLDIATKMAKALAAAHGAGIIHRDVKPANILVESAGPGVWLADFGLARAARHGFGKGVVVGTPGYAAPEVMEGEPGTAVSDLYSLGAVLREALTGVKPASFGDGKDMLPTEELKNLTDTGVPSWFVELVSDLLKPDPARRPRSAEEVLERIEKNLESDLESKTRKHAQRHVWRVAGFVAIGCGVLIATAAVVEALSGFVFVNSAIRKITGDPVSLDGRIGSFETLEQALGAVAGDKATIRIERGARLEVKERIDFSGRFLRLVSRPGIPTDLVFARGLDSGLFEVREGRLVVENLNLRFRGAGTRDLESLVSLYDSDAEFTNVIMRRLGGKVSNSVESLFILRGTGHLSFSGCNLMAERSGKGIVAVSTQETEKTIRIVDSRFVGEILVHFVSPEDEDLADAGRVEMSLEGSAFLTACPIRIGRNAGRVHMAIHSQRNLWQESGPMLNFRRIESDSVRRNFHFHDAGSYIAVGRTEAIYTASMISNSRVLMSRGNPEMAQKDWVDFWGESPNVSLEGTEWVSWIVDYGAGRVPQWNPDLDLTDWGEGVRESDIFE